MKKFSILMFAIFSFIVLPIRVYADGAPISYSSASENIAVVGEEFVYTLKGTAWLNGSTLGGSVVYDKDIFEFVDVIDNPAPGVMDVLGFEGKISKKVSEGNIVFNYGFINYEQEAGERVDLSFKFKVKALSANSKSTIRYIPDVSINSFYDGKPLDLEIKIITSEFDRDSVKCTCEYENTMKENDDANDDVNMNCTVVDGEGNIIEGDLNCNDANEEEKALTDKVQSNKSSNNLIIYCTLGTSGVLLIAFIIVLIKYLKLKKQ